MSGGPVRVLLVDDQELVRTGFRLILRNEESVDVVAEASDGLEAVELAASVAPDVVLMDLRMPHLDGVEATRRIVDLGGPRVLVLTTFDEDEYVYASLRAGASGFLLKDAPATRLLAAIDVVAAGGSLFDPSVTTRLIERFADLGAADLGVRGLESLSSRELEVLVLVAQGMSNAEIAGSLFVSEHTVKSHVASLLTKLDLRNRVQAVIAAYESGLVRPSR